MSAIFGIFYRDGRPVNPADVERMQAILAHRGSDSTGTWVRGPVGLGHRMLHTTPESLYEHQPLISRDGTLVLTADARIDNRDELISALDVRDRPAGLVTDADLILAAYDRWGERCSEHLLGDFAFAIWDERRQVLICVRDHMGVKPLYYYSDNTKVIFATEAKAIICLGTVSTEVNELHIADFLVGIPGEPTSTFYLHIHRLPAAHSIAWASDQSQTFRYWSLNPEHELHFKSDSDYVDAFRDLFIDSVSKRTRSQSLVGTTLSGGLDSSAVTSIASKQLQAQNKRLHTFSGVFDAIPECDERYYIHQVLAKGEMNASFVAGDRKGPLIDLQRMLWHNDEPFFAPGLHFTETLYESSMHKGVKVLLDGEDGDGVVSHGSGYLLELARNGELIPLAHNLFGLSQTYSDPFLPALWAYSWQLYLRPRLRRNKVFSTATRAFRRMTFLNSQSQAAFSQTESNWDAFFDRSFIARTNLRQRMQEYQTAQRNASQNERAAHYQQLTASTKVTALEILDKSAQAFGVELRHPFWDRRLVELCLALPPTQKLHRGWSRLILRRAIEPFLPQKVVWRKTKSDFLPNFRRGLFILDYNKFHSSLKNNGGRISEYINTRKLERSSKKYTINNSHNNAQEIFFLFRLITLNQWLQLTYR